MLSIDDWGDKGIGHAGTTGILPNFLTDRKPHLPKMTVYSIGNGCEKWVNLTAIVINCHQNVMKF
jgi:hypothetical protein